MNPTSIGENNYIHHSKFYLHKELV